jgi:HK97 family phage portal protein
MLVTSCPPVPDKREPLRGLSPFMGANVILATRQGDQHRDVTLGATMQSLGLARSPFPTTPVSPTSVAGLPAFGAAVRIASQSVAKLDLGVWRGLDFERTRVTSTWQARFFGGVPNERDDWFMLKEQTEASLTSRHNAYWLKVKDAGRVAAVHFLRPEAVRVRWNGDLNRAEYQVMPTQPDDQTVQARAGEWLTSSEIIHFRVGYPSPGYIVAPSPVAVYRDALGSAVAKQRYEMALYESGILQSIAVTFPQGVTKQQADDFREVFQAENGGVENRPRVKVLGGGATVSTIGLSLEDAQFVDSMHLSAIDIARITGVPSSLIESSSRNQERVGPTPELEEDRWLRYGLGPRLMRIEGAIKRDPDFFGPGARDYPWFDSSAVLRGDLKTEADIALSKVQSGQWLVDEARARDGLPPLPNGAGKIPQIVPVGGAPNPNTGASNNGNDGGDNLNTVAPQDLQIRIRDEATERQADVFAEQMRLVVNANQAALERISAEQTASAREIGQAIRDAQPVITIEQPAITVEAAELAAPDVEVCVDMGPVAEAIDRLTEAVVTRPPDPAPVVNVLPDEGGTKKVTVERNMGGQLTGLTIEEQGG